MIWLTWRQFRGQALAVLAALAALAIYLVVLGGQIRRTHDANLECATGCSVDAARRALENAYALPLTLLGFLLILVPALLGAFWGAPLIARELETGTHQLVWNQSVTRARWLAGKLGFITLVGVAVTGALSLLLTWAASPYDQLTGERFEPLDFPTRNIVSLGYAGFAILLGTTAGLFIRRTVMAMAVTLAAFAALQVLVPAVIRPHLQPPVTETVAFTAAAAESSGIQISPDGATTEPFGIPGAWIFSGRTPLRDAAGNPVTHEQLTEAGCVAGDFDQDMACLAAQDLHYTATYQPADRYWTFQWLEFGGYLALAGLLAGFVFWRIPRGLH